MGRGSYRLGMNRPGFPIEPGVGSKGDSYPNALAETINGLCMCKAEVIHWRTWKIHEAVELATLTLVSWFNNHRLMGSWAASRHLALNAAPYLFHSTSVMHSPIAPAQAVEL